MDVFDLIEQEAKLVSLSEYANAENKKQFLEGVLFEAQIYPKSRDPLIIEGCIHYLDELLWNSAKSKNLV